jgi:hypothetical protein
MNTPLFVQKPDSTSSLEFFHRGVFSGVAVDKKLLLNIKNED